MPTSWFAPSSARHLPHPGGIGRVRLHGEIARERGPRFGWAALLHQRNTVPAPRVGRSVGIDDRGGIALVGSDLVAGTVPKPPDLAFVEAKKPVPTVLRESLDQILA